jgi:hypothetical protein
MPATASRQFSLFAPLIFALLFFIAMAHPQSSSRTSKQHLRQLSSPELQACFDNLKLCDAASIYEISDEFVRRLPHLSTDQLLACFDDWKICGTGEGQAQGWRISDELARRGKITPILARYWHEPKSAIRGGIEHFAYHFNTSETTAFMQQVFAAKQGDGEDLYWPTNYLAKRCDPEALKSLSTGKYRKQGCIQYQTSVALFGKCRYRPAIPYLIDSTLDDFCGNITDAGLEDLRILFPHSPLNFDNPNEMQHYFCARAKKENYSVSCSTN